MAVDRQHVCGNVFSYYLKNMGKQPAAYRLLTTYKISSVCVEN
jgi:hypothetical protein